MSKSLLLLSSSLSNWAHVSIVSNSDLHSNSAFTRLSSGTYFDANGIMQTALANQPRFHHLQDGSGKYGLLIEGSRTNLCDRSFADVGWSTNASATKSGSTLTSPDGTINATQLTVSTNSSSGIYDIYNVSAAAQYTFSAFVKHQSGSSTKLRFGSDQTADWGASTAFSVTFDFSTESFTFTGSAVSSSSVAYLNNGWYRITLTGTSDAGASGNDVVHLYNGDGANTGVFGVFGVQIEQAGFASSFIGTNGSTVTRAADVVSVDLTTSPWFNASEGTILVDWYDEQKDTGGVNQTIFMISDSTLANRISIFKKDFGEPADRALRVSGGVSEQVSESNFIAGSHKDVIAYAPDDYAYIHNGSALYTDNSVTPPENVTTFEIGAELGGKQLFGIISELKYFPVRLSDSLSQEVSS